MFSPGQIVSLRVDPTREGPIIEVLPSIGGAPRYRVYHGPNHIGEYDQGQLIAAAPPRPSSALLGALLDGRTLEEPVFRARVTAERLSHPQVDALYALQAARIQYVPFQYKPLLRLLRAERPRMLIADEVGVGKTIEAGLILKELQARQDIAKVLIVCPKALVGKWRMEMRRFDEEFRPLSAEALRYCLREMSVEDTWPSEYNRAIAHLELLRISDYLEGDPGKREQPGLLTLDPAPRWDLVIVDEAHHLRNTETNANILGRFLAEQSETLLFLSATPVHVGSQNLWQLLHLLRPELFEDQAVFEAMVEPNRFLAAALRLVRTRAPEGTWQQEAAAALLEAVRTEWGQQVLAGDPRMVEWQTRMRRSSPLTDEERIRCMRDLEEVHPFAHIMNRTRRRDIGRFTTREAHTIEVAFSTEQEQFYHSLIEFRRQVVMLKHDARVARLVSDTLERQAASCLPGLVPLLEQFLSTGRFTRRDIADDPDDEDLELPLPPTLIEHGRRLQALAADLPFEDAKLTALVRLIQDTLIGGGPGKLLLFSFFMHTLSYLERNLRAAGYRVAVITGAVPDDERERLRDRFRLPRSHANAVDVLLSSEVGSEGLDYQFCDRLVNYDIPWNPMRIEQRIGRVDRFGQQSDKVLIFNFITPGTVEERIFFRCFERLGVFRDTVGDLEEVLGDIVDDLTRVALDPSLTPEQAAARALQMADNALRHTEEQRRLEEESSSVLGVDQLADGEIDTLVAEGRFVGADDVRVLVERFLYAIGASLASEVGDTRWQLRVRGNARTELLQRIRALGRTDRSTLRFTKWLEGREPAMALTFDQPTALEHRDLPFVTPVHPLARAARAYWHSENEPLVAQLSVADEAIPAGQYLFVYDVWESLAIKPELRLVGMAWDLHAGRITSGVSATLLRLMQTARAPEHRSRIQREQIEAAWTGLDEAIFQERIQAADVLRERNHQLLARKIGSLDAYYRNRIERLQSELRRTQDARIIRMKQAEHDRISVDYEKQRAALEARRDTDIVHHRIAAGILEVIHAQ